VEPETVDYPPGQFILLKIQDKPRMFRAFSISSHNEDKTRVSITVKKIPGGYGSSIISGKLKTGDTVELEGPMGNELVIDKNAEKVLLIAGGIGITPFRSIVKEIVDKPESGQSATLVYGVNSADEFLYNDEFKEFESRSDRFDYSQVVASDTSWTGEKGYVTDVIKNMDLTGFQVYMCGPNPMIDAALRTLESKGVSSEVVYFESA
jgi:NAD(P)H-flavin reductase